MAPRTSARQHTTRRTQPPRPHPTARQSPARQWTVDFRRALRRHRRKLAVLATLAAVLTGLTALAPPRPATLSVVTAARPLAAGTTITAGDLDRTALPTGAVPGGAVTEPTMLVGQKLAGPVPQRQVLTPSALLGQRSTGRGAVVAPLPLADDRVSGLLESGDVVDVLAADSQNGKAQVVASAVRVVTGPIDGSGDAPGAGGASRGPDGALVLVEVSPDTATALAAAATTGSLSIVWH